MKKRIISLLLALALVWAATPPALAGAAGYSDVPPGHWAAKDIARATELGLFKGVGDGKFGLGQPITRAEFVTALVRFFGWTQVQPETPSFTDVPLEKWYAKAVETALANGAVTAADSTFRPDSDITRAELVEMLIRGMGYASLAGHAADAYDPDFSDVTAKEGFITLAHDMGIVSGVGKDSFDPDGTATREQAAVILVRTYDRWYAGTEKVTELGSGDVTVTVEAPEAQAGTEIPLTPLEPLPELYDALRKLRAGGQDMSKAVLELTGGGIRTLTAGGQLLGSAPVTAEEVARLLEKEGTSSYYSDRYQSAYFIYRPNGEQTATVWYQSPESLAAKLQLARLFGVTRYLVR